MKVASAISKKFFHFQIALFEMALPSKIPVSTGLSAGNTAHLVRQPKIHILKKFFGWSTRPTTPLLKKIVACICVTTVVSGFSSFNMQSAFAADEATPTRLATVDVHRILNELEESQEKRKKLDSLSLNAKRDVDKKREALKDLEEKIKRKNLSADSAEAERFRRDAKDLQRYIRDTEEELKREYLKINRSLTEEVIGAIQKYAKDNKIDLVLDKSQAVRGPVLFGDPTTDITDTILRKLNG